MKKPLFIGILLAAMNATAFAGIYQRTRHTHAKVWNAEPTSFQEVTWSGGKDGSGFAAGYGTLTWYAPEKPPTTGSNIPNRRRMVITASYSGTMEHGKFVGPTTIGGAAQASASSSAGKKSATSHLSTPSPTAKAPSPSVKEKAALATAPAPATSPPISSSPAASPTPSASGSAPPDSLNSLTRPPSSLNLNTPAETSPSPHPTPEESSSPSP